MCIRSCQDSTLVLITYAASLHHSSARLWSLTVSTHSGLSLSIYRSLLMPALMPRPGSRWLAGGRGGGMRCWSVSQTLLAGV